MEKELYVKMALSGWHGQNKRVQLLLDKLTDEQLNRQVSPGRNRGIYLMGHLATVSDMMLPLLGLGKPLNPAMQEIFVNVPDGAVKELPSIEKISEYWKEVNAALDAGFSEMKADDWFGPHTVVNEEDFKKDPGRNKLNIVLSRTSHLAYHFGQLALLQSVQKEA
jgi:DinB superfamily